MSKIRILHTADLHMDSPFESLSEGKAAIRRAELRSLPKKIAALAIKEKVDVVLLSGDLLDGESVYRETADELVRYLRKIPAPVFIAPGNHDYYSSTSVYAKLELPEQVCLFTKNTIEVFDFPEKGFRVYGAAFTD
ncbi:MAG: metallophosphoesterase, partial [Oscillospiraceae bacterium]|nr:metallophosphoesterase [Oscillospiraceae bacterium]